MTRNKVKGIVEYLTSTYESDTANIHFGMSQTTLYLPYNAIYDCDRRLLSATNAKEHQV